MPAFRYVEYPDAKVSDESDRQMNHLLFGDWVRLEGAPSNGRVKVRVRGTTGFMDISELREDRVLEAAIVGYR
jgi:hypothetical protein